MFRFLPVLLLAIGIVGAVFQTAAAQEWPRFRGPNGSGVGQAARLPASWDQEDYRWQLDLPGPGHSSPVVWGRRLFLTCGLEDSGTRCVLCIDAEDGKLLWRRDFTSQTHRKHALNTFASSSPAADEQHVYIAWATPEEFIVLALDHDGQSVWREDLGPFKGGHGFGVSPIVVDDLLIVANEQEGESFLLALDRRTGRTVWKTPRDSRVTYSTPCVFQRGEKEPAQLIFTNWTHGITAVDPSSGQTVWEKKVFGPELETAISSPVVAGDIVIGSCGYLGREKRIVAVRPQSTSQGIEVQELYRYERSTPLTTTPLVVGDLLFLWSDEGIVICADVRTGEQHWKRRVAGTYYGSPVYAAGNIYCITADGEAVVIRAETEFELLARNNLGAQSNSTPAIAHGRMYLRTVEKLMCLEGK